MHSFILDRLHYGHLGIEKTRHRAKESGYWININRGIETTVKSCQPCLSSSVVSVTKQIFSETGVPYRVVSDNDPHFASACYADLS